MKKKLIAGFLLAGSCLFAAPRVAIGIGVGVPVAPYVAPYGYVAPPIPGPGYTWVGGYWYGVGPHRAWRAGYWAAPHRVYFGARGRFRR
jgi:hypothetical protein